MKTKVELKHVVTNKVNKIVTAVAASLYIDNMCVCVVKLNDDLSLQLSPFSLPLKEKRFKDAKIDPNWLIVELIAYFNNQSKITIMKTLKSLPNGSFYKLSETSKTVYQKLDYNRYTKKFDSQNQTTCNYVQHKGEKMVFVNFEY